MIEISKVNRKVLEFLGNLYFTILSAKALMQTTESGTDILMGEARKMAQPRVVIGIAAYNIENVIEKIVASLNPIADEILVCDDASTDSTAKIAESLNCKMIIHPHRLGQAATMRSIFLAANQDRADVLLTVATDMSGDPGDLSKLVDSVARHESDIAVGSRFPLKPIGSTENASGGSISTVFGLPVQDPKSPFKAYGKAAIAAVVSNSLEKANILPEARRLDLGIMEYEVSAKPFVGPAARNRSRLRSRSPMDRMVDFTALRHPIAFYTGPSIIALIAALFVTYLTYEAWISGLGLQLTGVVVAMTLFLIWVILGVTGAILHSIGSSREIE